MTVELTITTNLGQYVIPGQDDITDTVDSWVAWMRENAANGVYSAETADGSWVVIPLNRIDAVWGHPEPDGDTR